jgi:hypothetical protein
MNIHPKNNTGDLLERLNILCDNDRTFIKDFVVLFRKNSKQAMSEINQTNPTKTLADIQIIAHNLKSNFLIFEFMEASTLASEIENTQTYEEMKPIIKRLNALFLNILDELASVNKSLSG